MSKKGKEEENNIKNGDKISQSQQVKSKGKNYSEDSNNKLPTDPNIKPPEYILVTEMKNNKGDTIKEDGNKIRKEKKNSK